MTGLQKQLVPMPFAQGLNSKQDPKQVPMGQMLTLENGFFQTPGEIRKRYGFNALGTSLLNQSGTLFSVTGMFPYQNELVATGYGGSSINFPNTFGSQLFTYDQGNSKWATVGPYVPMKLTTAPIASSGNNPPSAADSAYDPTTGLQVFIWLEAAVLFVAVKDRATGATIFYTGSVSGGTVVLDCRVIFYRSQFVILIAKAAGISYATIDPATPTTISAFSTLISDSNATNPRFDTALTATTLYIAYNYTTTGVKVAKYAALAGGSTATILNTSHAATGAIGVAFRDTTELAVCYSNNSNVYAFINDANLSGYNLVETTIAATANVNQIALIAADTQTLGFWVYFCAYTNHSINNLTQYALFATAAALRFATNFQRSVSLASKPFIYQDRVYILLQYGGVPPGQPTLFLFAQGEFFATTPNPTYPGAVVAKLAPGITYDADRKGVAQVLNTATGVFEIPYLQIGGVNEAAGLAAVWNAVFDMTAAPTAAEIANTLHLSGGQLWMYDGFSSVEHGFHLFPEIISVSGNGSGGPFVTGATYEYVAVYEWIDNQGQLHRSAPSLPETFVAGGTYTDVTFTVSTLRVTNKRSTALTGTRPLPNNVRIYIYSTDTNGTILYNTDFIANDITADTVAKNITFGGTIELYTTGGQVENSSAPPCLAVTTFKSRLIVIPSDNPYSWWFSQEVIPSSASSSGTPVELSEFFVQNINQSGGPLTGAIAMDDKLLLMKKGSPYYVVGNGPAPNGTSNDYSPPQVITSPVGSTIQNSMVLTPFGLVFEAANDAGLWLLSRGLEASYIGDGVESYNNQDVTSAVLYPQYNQVRFTMSGGVTLAYDYYVKQWTVMTGITAVQACIFQGAWSWVNATGQVYQESTATFTDNGTFVQLKVIPAWFQLAGLQGFQRVYEALILGDYESAHTLNVKVYYDFDDVNIAQTTAITPTSTPPYQWRLLFTRQKCEAIKLEIYDSEISPAEAMRLSAISLKVGVKGGLNRLPAARTFE